MASPKPQQQMSGDLEHVELSKAPEPLKNEMASLRAERKRFEGTAHVVAVSIPISSGHPTNPMKRQRQVSGGLEHANGAGSLGLRGEQMPISKWQRKVQLESPVVPLTPAGQKGKRALLSPLPTSLTDMEIEVARVQSEAPTKPSTPTRIEGDAATSSLAPIKLANPMTPSTPHTSFPRSIHPSTPEGAHASLLPGQELSTTAISLILGLLRNTTVYGYDAGWYDSHRPITRPRATSEATTFLLPIHRAGHWNLAVLEPERKVAKCFDSLGEMDKDLMANLKRDLKTFDGGGGAKGKRGGQWRVEPQTTPQQSNAVDCGVFVLAVAMCIVVDGDVPTELDAVVWRDIFRSIVNNKAEESLLGDYVRYGNKQGHASRAGLNTSSVGFSSLTARIPDDTQLCRKSAKQQYHLVRARAEKVRNEIGMIRDLLHGVCTRLTRPPMERIERLQVGRTVTSAAFATCEAIVSDMQAELSRFHTQAQGPNGV